MQAHAVPGSVECTLIPTDRHRARPPTNEAPAPPSFHPRGRRRQRGRSAGGRPAVTIGGTNVPSGDPADSADAPVCGKSQSPDP
ncbi:unnamed protein product [Macrosiphum euphorbiae]|uniref:Uncharacterized protein n=1 Tax=Macrosiphum euphorbiae TaxID=13131 RepID=A0AAV0XS51_9HEMI|nr:unnamed protein product [Macrosiphum euphorbiae]